MNRGAIIQMTFNVLLILAIGILFYMSGCKTNGTRTDKVVNKTAENVTEFRDYKTLNTPCILAAFIAQQQLAKKSDQNLAEPLVNACITETMIVTCKKNQDYFRQPRDCFDLYGKRK